MSPEFISSAATVVSATYGEEHVRSAQDGARTLIRIDRVDLYETSNPPSTPMLLMFDPAQPKPQAYVQPGQLLANGQAPRSTSTVMVGGESWMQFSFNVPWEEKHGITRFIAAARQRFAQND